MMFRKQQQLINTLTPREIIMICVSVAATAAKNAKVSDSKPSQCRSTDVPKLISKEVHAVCADHSELDTVSRIVCNDLLAYVHCYRDVSNTDALRRVVLNFFSSEDISTAKKLLRQEFHSVLSSNEMLTERRCSASRPAHEAEVDDIFGIFDALDAQNVLHSHFFTVTNLLKVPKYGPEEINIAVVVDRQVATESCITKLADDLDQLKVELLDTSTKQTAEVLSMMNKKLDSLTNVVTTFASGTSVAVGSSSTSSSAHVPLTKPVKSYTETDRSMNLIMFGIAEDRDANAWRSKVDAALSFVSGRAVDVVDMFRLGGKFDSSKVRPVLVKLRTVWDRRIILSQSYKLKQFAEQVYIAPDEPLEARRKRIFDRKKAAAVRDGKEVEVMDNVLVVNGIEVYSMKVGFIACNDG